MAAVGSRRGPTKGDQREQSLINAARVLLRQKPLHEVTIEDISSCAGIGRSGFYFYFESKQALLAALSDQVVGEAGDDIAEWLAEDGLGRAALRRGLAGSLERWKVDGRWLAEVFVNPDPGPDIAQIRAQLIDGSCAAVLAHIAGKARAGVATAGSSLLLARMIITLRFSVLAQAYHQPSFTDDELLDTLTEAILRLVYGSVPDDEGA